MTKVAHTDGNKATNNCPLEEWIVEKKVELANVSRFGTLSGIKDPWMGTISGDSTSGKRQPSDKIVPFYVKRSNFPHALRTKLDLSGGDPPYVTIGAYTLRISIM